MIFKNLMLYQLTQPALLYFQPLREKLADSAFHPCGPSQSFSAGFVPPADTELTHEQLDILMVAVQIQEKKIPASALADLVAAKVAVIEAEQARKVYRKERLTIKDEILMDKLPSVIPTNKRVYAYIDAWSDLVVVDSGSPAGAEIVLNLIRECIGSFPVLIPQVNISPVHCMTMWLRGHALPDNFRPGYDCELIEPGKDGGKVRCKGIDVFSDEITAHIDAGRQVSQLRVVWGGQLSAVIVDQGRVKSVKLSDELLAASKEESEDDTTRFDADMALMVGTLREFIPALHGAFGGLLEQKFMDLKEAS